MAKLLKCRDVDLECDYLCGETEEQVLSRAARIAGVDQGWLEVPGEFQDRVRAALRTVDRC